MSISRGIEYLKAASIVPVFIISLAIGLFITYAIAPKPDIIYVYPTPDNVDKIQYKDKSGSCFGFTYKEVSCPNDKSAIQQYPLQERHRK